MTTQFEETQKKSEYQDLNEEDSLKVINYPFKDFKVLFSFTEMSLAQAIQILLVCRQRLENEMSQRFGHIKDVHKKHAWLNQKLSDALKMNTIAILRMEADKKVQAHLEAEKAKQEAEGAGLVTKEDLTGHRRFHVIPGSET